MIIINKIKIVLNVENIRNVFAGKMIKYHYPYVSKYIYRTQDLAKVASFSDSKPQKQHYAKINGEGGNLAASKIRNLECPSYEICLIDYGCGKFNRKIHIMEQYP